MMRTFEEMMNNFILNADAYKYCQWQLMPPKTQYVYSYIESRGGKWDRTVFFGLQMFIKRYLSKPITMEDIDEAEPVILEMGLPFYREGWEYIVKVHGGKLPVEIKSIKEGLVVPTHNALVTIVNTDPNCYWLVQFMETSLLRAIWYPVTTGTNSYRCKQVIKKYLDETADDTEAEINFKSHDFAARGVSSHESAAIGGCAHLVHSMGTDTVEGVIAAKCFYSAGPVGFSISASEHSNMTSWGGPEGEPEAMLNMINVYGKPGKIFACVSDSYDIFNAITNYWGGRFKEALIASGATLVVRPDSGDPKTIPVKCIQLLMEKFGYTINSKGYKVLPSCVRLIQGDGINMDTIGIILENLKQAGISASNIAFGQGGALLQIVNRDDFKFAAKCSAICVDGVWRDVYKDPITDSGKRSKRGRFCVIAENGFYETVPMSGNTWRDELHTTYLNGDLLNEITFDEVRANSNKPCVMPH